MDIKTQLLDIIQEYLDFPAAELDTSASLRTMAAIDSFILIEMVGAIEEKFGISIPNADLKAIKTLDDMIAYIGTRTGA